MTDEVKRLRKAFRLYRARREAMQALIENCIIRKGSSSQPCTFVSITDLENRYRMGMEIAQAILENRSPNWYLAPWLKWSERIRRTVTNYI